MAKKYNSATSLSYHLAEALTGYIYASGGRLNQRKNLLAFIHGVVGAMLAWKDLARDDLSEIEQDLVFLEETYEPVLDTSPVMFEKRAAYEDYLRLTANKLLKLIYDNNLVSQSVMKEVYAARWRKGGEVME
ncbi:MAG: hypothetical protein RBT82_12435 [Desulfomonilia bacterium]|jgi:hypothetical protein|nr:hypothetical protein [Desulfomonilia bacterium]